MRSIALPSIMSRTPSPYRLYFLLFFLSGQFTFLVFAQVFTLTEHNFDKLVRDKDVFLIEFFMPWCKHCQALQPQWEEAEQVLERNNEYILGKVNCWEDGKALCDKLDIQMYPEIRLYRHGKYVESYDGERNAESILEYVERAQATTGKVGSVPFWDKPTVPGAPPPEGHVPVEPLPGAGPPANPAPAAPAALSPTHPMPPPPPPLMAPAPQPAMLPQAPLMAPPPVPHIPQGQMYQHHPVAPPPPPLPPGAYQPNSTDILFTQTLDIAPQSVSSANIAAPPPPLPPPIYPPAPPPHPAPLPQVHPHPPLPPPHPPPHPPPPPPPHPPVIPMMKYPPAAPGQSTPVDEMTLAYNLAASQQDGSGTTTFWNNFKFWHDFLQFVNHGPHNYPGPPPVPSRQMLANNLRYMYPPAPEMSSFPTYQFQPKVTSFLLPGGNRPGMLMNNFVNPLHEQESIQAEMSDMLNQFPDDCQLRNNCPRLPSSHMFQAKAPVYYVPSLDLIRPALHQAKVVGGMSPSMFQPSMPSMLSYGEAPSYIDLETGLRKTKLPEKHEKPIPYIRPSVYKLLKRKKPMERFIKRPIVQGRYAVPISKALKQQMQLKENMKALAARPVPLAARPVPLAARPVPPVNRNRIMEIEKLKAQYALRHPQVPKVGNALIRGKVQKPLPPGRNTITPANRMLKRPPPPPKGRIVGGKPATPFVFPPRAVVRNPALANKRIPLAPGKVPVPPPRRPFVQRPPLLPVRKIIPPPALRRKLPYPPLRKQYLPPLTPQKKRLLPPSIIRKQMLTPYERTQLLPASLRKGIVPPSFRQFLPAAPVTDPRFQTAFKKMLPPRVANLSVHQKQDPDLVNIWDRLYRFYTTQGKEVKYDPQASHEIKHLIPKPSGIAVVENFLESKFKDMKKPNTRGASQLHNQVKTGVPVIRAPKNKKVEVVESTPTLTKDTTPSVASLEQKNITTIPKRDENILKGISHIPHPWDKRGKVTFALSKKNEIPGAPLVTGVWGSLRRRKKKRRKKRRNVRKKRSSADSSSDCDYLVSLTSADISYYTDIQRLIPECQHTSYAREYEYG